MDNHEPVFGKTHQQFDPQIQDVYPHKELAAHHLLFFFVEYFFYLDKGNIDNLGILFSIESNYFTQVIWLILEGSIVIDCFWQNSSALRSPTEGCLSP